MRCTPLRIVVAALAAALAPAVASAQEAENGKEFNGKEFNGKEFNGKEFNGKEFNGASFSGGAFTGGAFQGVNVAGTPVRLELDGSQLVGTYADHPGSTCSHSQLTTGPKLQPGCSKCVDIVSTAYPICTTSSWNGWCAMLARSLCAFDAFDLEGATMSVRTDTGDRVSLRFDEVAVAPDPTPQWRWVFDPATGKANYVNTSPNENEDIVTYDISYKRGGYFVLDDGVFKLVPVSWHKLCDFDDTRALAVGGHWKGGVCEDGCGGKVSDDGFELACRVGAIAKCVEMGLRPWEDAEERACVVDGPNPGCREVSLDGYHQACVRMLRSDVCGDGQHHTYDGTAIDVAGGMDVAQYDDLPSMGFEAEWGPGGAVCVSNTRHDMFDPAGIGGPTYSIGDYINDHCPDKWDHDWVGTECGDAVHFNMREDWTPRAHLMNRSSEIYETTRP